MSVWSTYYQLAARLSASHQGGRSTRWSSGAASTRRPPGATASSTPTSCASRRASTCSPSSPTASASARTTHDLRGCWVKRDGEIVRNPPRLLIPDLDVLPAADLSSEQQVLPRAQRTGATWRGWDAKARLLRHHDGARLSRSSAPSASTTSPARRPKGSAPTCAGAASTTSWRELRAAVRARPQLRAIAFSDDIFAPPRPWLEEFCARYKKEIGLPFIVYSYPAHGRREAGLAHARGGPVGADDGHPVGLRAHPPRLLRARDVATRRSSRRADVLAQPRRRAQPRLHRRQSLRDRRGSARDRRSARAACRSRSTSTTSR